MWLVGFCFTPMLNKMTIEYRSTSDFARRPLAWLQLIAKNGGTVAFSPSFGYDLCARRAANGAAADLDLSRWRVAGIGGGMVRADVLDRFAEMFASTGSADRRSSRALGTLEEPRSGVQSIMRLLYYVIVLKKIVTIT